MTYRYQLAVVLLVSAWLMPAEVNAEIFKCVAENGELTFSQAPCPEKGTTVTVVKSAGSSGGEPADCEYARQFALNTAQKMRSGTPSSAIFDSYGGLGALSKGSVSLISYVFQFRTNNDISASRVSALATAKCQARAFGDVRCDQLPPSFASRFGGCEKDEDGSELSSMTRTKVINTQLTQPHSLGGSSNTASSADTMAAARARDREAKERKEEQRLECRDRLKTQIDAINARMRGGYTVSQGESWKRQRRDLQERQREC